MTDWQAPDVIWRSDRSFRDKREEVHLERGEFNGSKTYKLRLLWRADDGKMRWSQARETSSGKCWAEFGLKARELQSLGELLIAESQSPQPALDVSEPAAATRGDGQPPSSSRPRRTFEARPADEPRASGASKAITDDIPF